MIHVFSINTIPMHVTLHTGDPGDTDGHALRTEPPTIAAVLDEIDRAVIGDLAVPAKILGATTGGSMASPLPASQFQRPALAIDLLRDGTIQHASWWWPDGRQVTVSDIESARLAAALRRATADADDRRRRWRPRVARALWQATQGGRR